MAALELLNWIDCDSQPPVWAASLVHVICSPEEPWITQLVIALATHGLESRVSKNAKTPRQLSPSITATPRHLLSCTWISMVTPQPQTGAARPERLPPPCTARTATSTISAPAS